MQKALNMLIILAFSSYSFAEVTGVIDTSISNNSFLTGLYGYTVWYCNSNSDCISSLFKCASDYDGISNTGYSGWCVPSAENFCVHNSSSSAYYGKTSSGSGICLNTTAYLSCSSGVWSQTKLCSSGYVCIDGSCSQQSSNPSSSSSAANYSASFIKILGYPEILNITPGSNFTERIIVKNGNTTQRNLSINISGINSSWYLIRPEKISLIYAGESAVFNLSFFIPEYALATSYSVIIKANTSNSSVSDSVSFILRIVMSNNSNNTLENLSRPSIEEYEKRLDALIEKFKSFNSSMEETKRKRTENLISFTKSKINEAKNLINSGDYSIGSILEEIEELLGEIEKSLEADRKNLDDSNFLVLILIAVTASSAGIAAFIFWPRKKEGYESDEGYIPSRKKSNYMEKMRRLFKRSKKEEAYIDGKEGKK